MSVASPALLKMTSASGMSRSSDPAPKRRLRSRTGRGNRALHDRQHFGGHALVAVDECLYLRVGQAGGAADERRIDADVTPRAVSIDVHFTGQRVARLTRYQRAQAVRQALGQHRQHLRRQVDARAPQPRLLVEGRARLHIGGNVGDGYPHPVTSRLFCRRHGVVKISGVLTVDK